jgi:hypothetical protein
MADESWHEAISIDDLINTRDVMVEREEALTARFRQLVRESGLQSVNDPQTRIMPVFASVLAERRRVREEIKAYEHAFVYRIDQESTRNLMLLWEASEERDDEDTSRIYRNNVQHRIDSAMDLFNETDPQDYDAMETMDFPKIIRMFDEFLTFSREPDHIIRCQHMSYLNIRTARQCWVTRYRAFLKHKQTRANAFMQATHARLGRDSLVHGLDPDLARRFILSEPPLAPAPWEGDDEDDEE